MITIIVLLILAAISIATLTGENGILTKAETAKRQTEIEEAKEQAKLDITDWIGDKLQKGESVDLNDSIVKTILSTGKKEYVKEARETDFTTKKSGYEIPYSELYNSAKEEEGKITFSINAYDSSHGGTFEVESGTTWYDFFHEKFPNDVYSWIYLIEDESIVEFILEDVRGLYAECVYLIDKNEQKVHKDDVIVSRYLSA